MKYVKKKILLTAIVILSFYFSSVSVMADPVVENITTNPTSPTLFSTITVTANITGEGISSVNLTISECDEEKCFFYKTYTMNKAESGDWVAEATLQDDSGKSTHIEYRFDVIDGGVPYILTDATWKVDLSTGNGNQNGDGDTTNSGDDNDIPGFEIITLLVAIIIGILLLKRKRF